MSQSSRSSVFRSLLQGLLSAYALLMFVYLGLRWMIQPDWLLLGLLHTGSVYLYLPILIGSLVALLLRALRLSAIYLLLLVIGALWLFPRWMPALTPDQEAGIPLRMVTFNVFPANPTLDQVQEWILAEDADLVLLQEVAAPLADLVETYPYQNSEYLGSGNAVFSRLPILENEEFALAGVLQQRLMLDVAGRNLVVYNVHLMMPLNTDESLPLLLRYDERVRNQQIRDLLGRVQQEVDPVIVSGDFNMSEYSPIYQTLSAVLSDAYRTVSWGMGHTWPGGASEELGDFLPPLFRLDYVWYRGAIRARTVQIGERLGSDHLPLSLEMVLYSR